jgi:ribosomal protein S27AE
MEDVRLITLKCSNCAAPLQISDKLDRFICNYCGTEHALLHNSEGFYFRRLEERLDKLEKITEKGNAELAIKRLRSDLATRTHQYEVMVSEKEDQMRLLNSRRADAINSIIVMAAIQGALIMGNFPLQMYVIGQIVVVIYILYQLSQIGKIQSERQKTAEKFRPELERIRDDIDVLEIKIKKRIKLADS